MKKILLILVSVFGVSGLVWLLTKTAESAGCVPGVTECRGGDLWVCLGTGQGDLQWIPFEMNSPYCSYTGPVGSIYGVTITQQEEALDGVLVLVSNPTISSAWVGKLSSCPAAPGGIAALPECFRFNNLPTGEYTVAFICDGYITQEQQVVVSEGEDTFVVGTMVAA